MGEDTPYGLQRDDIHLFSQIVSVADVYDALLSKRPYAGPQTKEEVINYILGLAGQKFNPEIVGLLCWAKTTIG
jgi:HD-GYP domain-containing protein (c-di-GMP phosphodiesterase class II)